MWGLNITWLLSDLNKCTIRWSFILLFLVSISETYDVFVLQMDSNNTAGASRDAIRPHRLYFWSRNVQDGLHPWRVTLWSWCVRWWWLKRSYGDRVGSCWTSRKLHGCNCQETCTTLRRITKKQLWWLLYFLVLFNSIHFFLSVFEFCHSRKNIEPIIRFLRQWPCVHASYFYYNSLFDCSPPQMWIPVKNKKGLLCVLLFELLNPNHSQH